MKFQHLLLVTFMLFTVNVTTQNPIKHVVVLMMENRSFDHLLGWMTRGGPFGNPKVDGLTGKECNPTNFSDPNSPLICANDQAIDECPYDPDHGFVATTSRIFACDFITKSNSPCWNASMSNGNASMNGFVTVGVREGNDGKNEMSMWPPERIPVMTTLANEFALFDHYFCSYPGPTNPNRLFMHAGTCNGCHDNEQTLGSFPNKTLQQQLEEKGLTWRYYFEDNPEDWFLYIDHFNKNFKNASLFAPNEQFYQDAAQGTLPNYTFIQPSESVNPQLNNTKSFGLMNDQHPDHSIREGERLFKNVYEALRNGPLWNETLFIINYDEHGGFYDHVSPPQGDDVPNPDGKTSIFGFNYTRLGIRVPMIAISPWIEKGTLINKPQDHQKPYPSSQFEHSSVVATIQKIFNITEPLSKRTEWAATFDDLLKVRTTPRTDCPTKLPDVPSPTEEDYHYFYNLPLQKTEKEKIQRVCTQNRKGDDCGKDITNKLQFSNFLRQEWDQYFANMAQELYQDTIKFLQK